MAIIKSIKGISPVWGKECFFADNATVVGEVVMGDRCSVWFNAVVRGDVNSIKIGDQVNIQDGAIIHCTYQKAATQIGDRTSIGHNAIVHGCTLEQEVLVGMGAIVMDHAVVEARSIVAAGAVVLENTRVESGWIYAGIPAKKVKKIEGALAEVFARTANNYVMYAQWFDSEQPELPNG